MSDTKKKLSLGFTTSSEDRESKDYYATDPIATMALIKEEKFFDTILEPCCGEGFISKELESKGYNVISTDLYDYGYGKSGIDFLDEKNKYMKKLRGEVDIVTNPPYSLTIPFVVRALEVCRNKVAMLFPLSYLPRFYFCRPAKLYVFARRITMAKGGDFDKYKKQNMIEYGWYVWYKGYDGNTTIKYIDNTEMISPKNETYIEKAMNFEKWNQSKDAKKEKVRELFLSGMAKREIARIVGQSESCVRNWLKEME